MTDLQFSRPLRVEPLPRNGLDMDIAADAGERERLARLNGLPGIERLEAHFRIRKWRRGVAVEGELVAKITQTCVVSLEPFDAEIEEPIDVKYLPYDPDRPPPESCEDDDAPDPLIDGRIDLGAIASEFLTLALDPYPRKPGVAFDQPADAAERESPFDRLRSLSGRDEPD